MFGVDCMRAARRGIWLVPLVAGVGGCAPADVGSSDPTREPPKASGLARDVESIVPRWPSATEIDRDVVALLPEATRARLATVRLPVLLPNDARLLRGTFVGKPLFYSQSTRVDGGDLVGTHVVVSATRVAHHHASVTPVTLPHRVRGVPALVTRNEGIPRVSFEEHGVAYTVEIVCDTPSDARCKSDEAVRALAETLVFVGGDATSDRTTEGAAR